MKYEYQVIRSGRGSVALEIKNGKLLVRAPYCVSDREIEDLVSSHEKWIEAHLRTQRAQIAKEGAGKKLTEEELADLMRRAKAYIPRRVWHYAPLVGVSFGRITIRAQRSKWGSCTAKGNLNFNCLLMLMPPRILDSVVVHELCHIREMNHSPRFYAEVLRVLPDYREAQKWLKENGERYLSMIDR